MTSQVTVANEVLLNGVRYPIIGEVRHTLVSQYAPKIVIGDTNKDSLQRASVVAWTDMRRGIGVDRFDGIQDTTRSWWSTMQQRYKNHLVLPRLAVQAGAAGIEITGSATIGTINDRANVIWATRGAEARAFTPNTNAWGSARTLAAAASDSINLRLGGVEYLVLACGSDYDYYNGSAWARSTKNAQYLASWDDRLWGIDSTGLLWWSTTLGTETDDAQLPLPNNSVTALFTGRDAAGLSILFAATTQGLYSHDINNQEFRKEENLSLPLHPDNGLGATGWRSDTYFPAGCAIYKLANGPSAVVTLVGPDRDDGLPADRHGTIVQLLATHNELLALIDGTESDNDEDLFQSDATSNSEVVTPAAGLSHILGWDGSGWESKWLSSGDTRALTTAHISSAYSDYRLWWGHDDKVYYMSMPSHIINPQQLPNIAYAASGEHEYPDFDAGQSEVDKVALRLRVETLGTSATETIIMAFALNGSETFTTLTSTYSSGVNGSGEITSPGIVTYTFPSTTSREGLAFRSIRFRVTAARGTASSTATPDVLSVTLEWRKKIAAQWGHTFTVGLAEEGYMEQSKELMFQNVRTAVEQNLLSEFTFRDRDADDTGASQPYNYYVDVVSAAGIERTGQDFTGQIQLTVVEV